MNILNKIKTLLKKILQYYVEKENKIKNTEYMFYIHTEFDSNVTEFEGLSNENKILLKSKLQIVDIPIILKIFQCIYDKNYFIFKEESLHFEECFLDYFDEDITDIYFEENRTKLFNYADLDIWIDFLTKIKTEQYNCEINDLDSENTEDIEDNFDFNIKFKEIPNAIGNSKTKQKLFKIKDIIELIEC